MKKELKTVNYKPVNIATDDWHTYNDTAKAMTTKIGVKVSIPAVLRMAMADLIIKEEIKLNDKKI